jgi:hypothetical protein
VASSAVSWRGSATSRACVGVNRSPSRMGMARRQSPPPQQLAPPPPELAPPPRPSRPASQRSWRVGREPRAHAWRHVAGYLGATSACAVVARLGAGRVPSPRSREIAGIDFRAVPGRAVRVAKILLLRTSLGRKPGRKPFRVRCRCFERLPSAQTGTGYSEPGVLLCNDHTRETRIDSPLCKPAAMTARTAFGIR